MLVCGVFAIAAKYDSTNVMPCCDSGGGGGHRREGSSNSTSGCNTITHRRLLSAEAAVCYGEDVLVYHYAILGWVVLFAMILVNYFSLVAYNRYSYPPSY